MSGACTVTPQYTFSTSGSGETVTNPKLNLLGQPLVTVGAGQITPTEIGSVNGSALLAGTVDVAAFNTATQSKFGFKNWCPNPAFDYWPYGTSFSSNYGANFGPLWNLYTPNGLTYTLTQQSTVAGVNDTLLQDSSKFVRLQTTSTSASGITLQVGIPNARVFSGQTITVSAVVENISGTLPALSINATQYFGTGGSPSSSVYNNATSSSLSVTNGWTKIYAVIPVATVLGKTFGTNGDDELQVGFSFANASTQFYFDIANVQVELGGAATGFENAINKPYQIIEQDNHCCDFVPTLTSGTPDMTGNVSAATNVYITPNGGNRVDLWTGYRWKKYTSSELTLALTSSFTANTVYDLFLYDSLGVVTVGTVAWTSTTARATSVTLQDGVWCLSSNKKWRYVGSFATNGTAGQTEWLLGGQGTNGAIASLLVYRQYGRRRFCVNTSDTTSGGWTYSTSTTRIWNAAYTTHFHRFLNGDPAGSKPALVRSSVYAAGANGTSALPAIGVAVSSVSNSGAIATSATSINAFTAFSAGSYSGVTNPGVNIGTGNGSTTRDWLRADVCAPTISNFMYPGLVYLYPVENPQNVGTTMAPLTGSTNALLNGGSQNLFTTEVEI